MRTPTYAAVQRLPDDRGPRGHVGLVLSLHRSASDAIAAATRAGVPRPIDAIRLPTRTAVGRRLYYRRRFVVETLLGPWGLAERTLEQLRAEQPAEPGNTPRRADECVWCDEPVRADQRRVEFAGRVLHDDGDIGDEFGCAAEYSEFLREG